ncbi:MAG: aldehyde dehydrogenase family protein [Pseudomonadota bacterium]
MSPALRADPGASPPDLRALRSWIGGAPVSGGGGAFELADPLTERALGTYAMASAAQAGDAAEAAVEAFEDGWGVVAPARRAEALRALIASVERRADAFAEIISAELGAPVSFTRGHHTERGLGHLRDIARAFEASLAAGGEDAPLSADAPAHRVRHAPHRVAALITPWNWPLNQVALKVGAALAAGCAMVLKPSELTPRSAVLFAEAMAEALAAVGAPPELFNLVLGDGDVGAALAAHPAVDVISFTGSTRAGGAVAATAARRLRPCVLELGGKSPNILFADCDLETAIRQGVAHCFRNAGQSCNAASRMLVARPIYEEAVRLAARAARETRPTPQVSRLQFERVQAHIARAEAEAAAGRMRLVAGGLGRPPGVSAGFISRPTVFADVDRRSALFQEEVFGPVLSLTPFDREAEAVALANAVPFGLAGYIQTADRGRADRVAQQLQVGMVQVNGASRLPGAPFGGVKASGWGREGGLWGVRAFQYAQSISGVPRA